MASDSRKRECANGGQRKEGDEYLSVDPRELYNLDYEEFKKRILNLTLPQAIRLINCAKLWFDELKEKDEARKTSAYIA